MIRTTHLAWVIALAIMVGSCAQDKLILSGATTVQVGELFVSTAHDMDVALDKGSITPDQYKAWATFGKKFQLVYPQVVSLWKIARMTGDPLLERQMMDKIVELGMELGKFVTNQGTK